MEEELNEKFVKGRRDSSRKTGVLVEEELEEKYVKGRRYSLTGEEHLDINRPIYCISKNRI